MGDMNFTICIGRQLGSGGQTIGKQLAQRLGIRFLDSEVLAIASGLSGIDKHFFESNDERKGLLATLANMISPISAGLSSMTSGGDQPLSREHLFQLQSDALRKVAEQESCLVVGRCADYVLREHPHIVSVFISADLDDRVKRISQLRKISEKEARRLVANADSQRADFYNYYANDDHRWGHAATYDLCVNSSVLGIDKTIDFVENFVRAKLCLLQNNE